MISSIAVKSTASAILLLFTGVQVQSSVTQSICAVTGDTATISCLCGPDVRHTKWYYNPETQPDILKNVHIQNRVYESTGWINIYSWTYMCNLTVSEVRVSDSGVYKLSYTTKRRSYWITAACAVTLTVTDLQVKVNPLTLGQKKVKVICSTTCSLNTFYLWYKNNIFVKSGPFIELDPSSTYNDGSYSCEVYGSNHRSPAVCVLGENCWDVTYSSERVCALNGSSVLFSCSYKYPEAYTVKKSVWFIKQQADGEAADLRDDEDYKNRVQYLQNNQNDCSIRINNLRESDAQTYRFSFSTNDPKGKFTGQPGIALAVTDLQVNVEPDVDRGTVTLNCRTTCILLYNYTFIWHKNKQHVSECKSASCVLPAVSDVVRFSCSVEGHESLSSPPVYSPQNTSAELISSGETVEGDSVTLMCSSNANPPVHTYSWFKQSADTDTLLTIGQNYSINKINMEHNGIYYCTVQNHLGNHNSTPVSLNVLRSVKILVLKLVAAGISVILILMFITGALLMWVRKSSTAKHRNSDRSVQASDSTKRPAAEDQDDVQYATILFKSLNTQNRSNSCTRYLTQGTMTTEDVEYATVNFNQPDSSQNYSLIEPKHTM